MEAGVGQAPPAEGFGTPSSSVPPGGVPAAPQHRSLGTPAEVEICGQVVSVYPQRVARLANRLGPTIQGFAESNENLDTEGLMGYLGDSVYDVLGIVIPQLPKRVPKWMFAGYGSEEAYRAGEYIDDENVDRSATFPEIVGAFETVWRVNRLDVLGGLKALVDPTLARKYLTAKVAERLSETSASSQRRLAGSDPTSSGPKSPTPSESAEPPSPGS